MLKAITGQDFVRMEEKFKAQRTEIAPVMVVVAANEPVQSADYTSGLERRLSMSFRHRPATPRDLLSWKDGAWRGELAPEISGVLNWVLALPDALMEALLQQTTDLVPASKRPGRMPSSIPTARGMGQPDAHPGWPHGYQGQTAGRGQCRARPRSTAEMTMSIKTSGSIPIPRLDRRHRGKPLSSRRFTGLLKDLFENQLRLEGVEHRDDNKGSRFSGLRFRTYSKEDADEPLLITKHPPPVTDVTPPVMVKTRASDGWDACDAFLHSLYGHLPTPCTSPPPRG